jgi:hypothetical protein
VENGKVDEQRLCITGRSAGGYTTLASLAFRDTFKAGASLYGVSSIFSGSIVCWAAIGKHSPDTQWVLQLLYLFSHKQFLESQNGIILDRYYDLYIGHP